MYGEAMSRKIRFPHDGAIRFQSIQTTHHLFKTIHIATMKKILSAFIAAVSVSLSAWAQTAENPILMTVAGKPVTRAEFEYAYNKNNNVEGAVESKTVEEYVEMFLNYKLKVAEAESQKVDTMTSFINEYRTYRDMQLTPHLVDQAYIDSVARSLYDKQVERIAGRDLIDCSHILLTLKQTDSNEVKQEVEKRADSLYNALCSGADFAALAKEYSEDFGSATRGGKLPTIYPGMTIKEFEDVAYALQPNQFCKPFLSPVGYHIILVHDRKQLEPYDTLYPTIIAALKRQNIDEASAKARIEKMMAETGKTREQILLATLEELEQQTPDLKYLVQEYYDGLLLYEVAKKRVWDAAAEDTDGLHAMFKKNKKKYAWTEPRYAGYIVCGKTTAAAKQTAKLLKKGLPEGKTLSAYLKETVNKDSVVVIATGPYLAKKGENSTIDNLCFGDKTRVIKPVRKGFEQVLLTGRRQKQPKTYLDVKQQVVTDLQQELEEAWVKELRAKFPYTIDTEVLKTVNKH